MSHYRRTLFAVGLLLAVGVLACTPDLGIGGPSKPTVEILGPPSGSQVEPGEVVEVQYRAVDAVAVLRVELEADERTVAVDRSPAAEGTPSLTGMLLWTATTPGSHTLLLHAYSRDGGVSDAVGLSIIVASAPPTPTPVPPTPTHTLAPPAPPPPTPTNTLVPAAPEPPTPTHTLAPPTSTLVPPTPTRTRVPPTPTRTPMSCPFITINVPSGTLPSRPFTLEWDSTPHEVPSGWEWGIRLKGAEATWTYLPVPLDPRPREEGGHWKADMLRGRGAIETLYWQVCLVSASDPARTFQCCSPEPPWPIIHSR